MEEREYETLYRLEGNYWWFRALRSVLLNVFRQIGAGPDSRVLDIGCGTGKTLSFLSEQTGIRGIALDNSPAACRFWPQMGIRRGTRASANALPFRDGSFDVVVAIDVLECDGVDERNSLREMHRVLRKGGHLILTVPAYRWLLSPEHHKAVHASRRYTRSELKPILSEEGLRLLRVTHLFMTVFPLIAAYRTGLRMKGSRGNGHPHSELKPLPALLNEILFRSVNWERRLLALTDLPVGSSLLALARKEA